MKLTKLLTTITLTLILTFSAAMVVGEELPMFEKEPYCIVAETDIFIYAPVGMIPSTTNILVKKMIEQPAQHMIDIFVDTKRNGVGGEWRDSVSVYYPAEKLYLFVLKKDVVDGNKCIIRM